MFHHGEPVKIDLTWYLDFYGHSEENITFVYSCGHREAGEIYDTWIDVDGSRLYNVKCFGDLVLRGAFDEKSLVKL